MQMVIYPWTEFYCIVMISILVDCGIPWLTIKWKRRLISTLQIVEHWIYDNSIWCYVLVIFRVRALISQKSWDTAISSIINQRTYKNVYGKIKWSILLHLWIPSCKDLSSYILLFGVFWWIFVCVLVVLMPILQCSMS